MRSPALLIGVCSASALLGTVGGLDREAAQAAEDRRVPTAAPAPTAVPAQGMDSYRVQVLVADLVAGTVAFGVAAHEHSPGPIIFWPFASPLVHAAHGNGMRALGSLALNIFVPLLGAFAGGSTLQSRCEGDGCGAAFGWGALHGAEVGAVVAAVIDIAFLASSTTQPPPSSIPSETALAMPGISIGTAGNVMVGWRARF